MENLDYKLLAGIKKEASSSDTTVKIHRELSKHVTDYYFNRDQTVVQRSNVNVYDAMCLISLSKRLTELMLMGREDDLSLAEHLIFSIRRTTDDLAISVRLMEEINKAKQDDPRR